jgi:ferredoxin-NADP reductase
MVKITSNFTAHVGSISSRSTFAEDTMSSTAMILLIITLLSLYLIYSVQEGCRRHYRQYRQKQQQQLQLYRLRRQGDLLKLWLRHPTGQLLPKALPGQHLQLFYQDQQNQPLSRAYSLASDCQQRRYYLLVIKIESAGRLTPLLAERLRQGQLLTCSLPKGHFGLTFSFRNWLAKYIKGSIRPKPLVLVAGGIGITPLLPMINAALRQQRPVALVYQARHAIDLLQHAKLKRLASITPLQYLPILSQPESSWLGLRGRINAARLAVIGGSSAEYVICASASMVLSLEQGLADLGCHHVKHELFSAAHSKQSFAITLGPTQANSLGHSSVLDALLASGVKVPYDCRGGSCGACALRLVSGSCSNVLHSEFSVGADQVLSCCVQATSALQLAWPKEVTDTEGQYPSASATMAVIDYRQG